MENLKILIFDEEELSKTLIEYYLNDFTYPYCIEKYNEFDELLIENTNENKIIIISVNKINSDILDKIKVSSQNKKNNFIIISYDKSADLSVKAFRNGAKDFLIKPLIKTDFLYSIQKIYNQFILEENKQIKSKVYSVSNLDEDVNTFDFLFNVSKETADISKENVLFADFSYSLNSIITAILKSNSSNFFSNVNKYNNSDLYILSNNTLSQNYALYTSSVSSQLPCENYEKIEIALSILKKYFKFVFINKNSLNCDINTIIEKNSDLIFYIINPQFNNIKKIKENLNENSDKKSMVVYSKYEKKYEKKLEQLRSELGKEIEIKIPKNIIAEEKARREHKTVKEIEPLLDISKVYHKTAMHILNRD